MRTNATDFEVTWREYIDEIIKMTVPNQISNGGPVIAVQIGEDPLIPAVLDWYTKDVPRKTTSTHSNRSTGLNTSHSWKKHTALMESLFLCECSARFPAFASLSSIASTYNDPGEGENFINGTGAVDIYGLVGCRVSACPSVSERLVGLVPSGIRLF